MNVRLERKDEEPAPINRTCPWKSCKSNILGYCHGLGNLVEGDVETYDDKDKCYYTVERLLCVNYERRDK